jgi:predicted phosphate transport protein (TIGR00153 family)
MNINNLFSFFAPKNDDFFPLLTETAFLAVKSSELLQELFNTTDELRKAELIKEIKAYEVLGDKVTGKIFKKLQSSFITPFDREDIHEVADGLEDIIDAINRCSQKIFLYSPQNIPECTIKQSDIIHKEALELEGAVNNLRNLKKNDQPIRAHCKAIKKLEEEADTEYQNAIISIFNSNMSTIEIVKIKEIIQELEKTANTIYACAKNIKILLVKYA